MVGKTHGLGKKKVGNRGRYVSRMRHAVSTGGAFWKVVAEAWPSGKRNRP